jgi:hypothetical protein
MLRLILVMILSYVLVAFVILAKASAEPVTPHCVTLREYRGLHLNPAITLGEMETRWDVVGDRITVTDNVENIGTYDAYLYQACDKSLNEVQIIVMTERKGRAAYVPKPKRNRIVISAVWWILPEDYQCEEFCD